MIVDDISVLFALTVASALCASSEVAFFSLPLSRLKSYRTDANSAKRQVAKLMQQGTGFLVTIFMLNTIINVLLQNSASNLFDHFGGGWILKVGLPLVIILLFGELIPKYFGLLYNETISQRYVGTLTFIQKIATPFRILLTSISKTLSRIFFFFLKAEAPLTIDELEHILQTSEGKGLLIRDEAEGILGVLELEQKQVRELMVPKSKMPLYDIQEPLSKLIHLFSEHRAREIPVVKMPQETILGVITASELFARRPQIQTGKDLLPYLKKPFFIPETTSAKSLLHQFAATDKASALVIDEYGQATGMIAELDLAREIAHTKEHAGADSALFKRVAKDTVVAQGTLTLDDVEELFGIQLESAYHVVTIGGWLTEKLGTIPKNGTTYTQEKLFFRVLSVDPTKVNKVYIQLLEEKNGL